MLHWLAEVKTQAVWSANRDPGIRPEPASNLGYKPRRDQKNADSDPAAGEKTSVQLLVVLIKLQLTIVIIFTSQKNFD